MNEKMLSLPFVRVSEMPVGASADLWATSETGNWSADNRAGASYAVALLDYMRERGAPNMLGSVVRAMIDKGHYGGVEVGFLHAVATAAIQVA